MWTTTLILIALCLVAVRIFFTVHNRIEVLSAGLTATACIMILLAILPLPLKLMLLASLFSVEWWLLHRSPASGV